MTPPKSKGNHSSFAFLPRNSKPIPSNLSFTSLTGFTFCQENKKNIEPLLTCLISPYRDKHGIRCQNDLRWIVRRAEQKGMKVNRAKTSMVCISGATSYAARSHLFFLGRPNRPVRRRNEGPWLPVFWQAFSPGSRGLDLQEGL